MVRLTMKQTLAPLIGAGLISLATGFTSGAVQPPAQLALTGD
jgi:hypothetical protein